MRIALLSDAHLAGPDDPNQRRFVAFLDGLEVDRLCLLGDIFQHWWHFGERPFEAYAPVVEALRRFPVTFVPGNHDFHAAGFFRDRGAQVADTIRAEWDGLRVHLAHGDEADASLGYRSLTRVLRSRAFAGLVDAMGPQRAWQFLARISGRPDGEPDPALLARQEARARALLADADLVVFGHTHAPGLHRWDEGVYVNLGDWVRHHTWLLVEDGVPSLQRHPA